MIPFTAFDKIVNTARVAPADVAALLADVSTGGNAFRRLTPQSGGNCCCCVRSVRISPTSVPCCPAFAQSLFLPGDGRGIASLLA